MKTRSAVVTASILASLLFGTVDMAAAQLAPINLAATSGNVPITDSSTGLISYIVDLQAHLQDQFPTTVTSEDRNRFGPRPTAQAINMVKWYEGQYGFEHTDMTSWVGNSFTAYLTPTQLNAIRADPNVVLVTENKLADLSVTLPPWYDTTHSSSQPPYYETSSWGRNAVNGKVSNNTYRIYVIDDGVGLHEDLTNVIARVNASCGTNNSGCPGVVTVGCYPHATHVAGIIAAAYGNKGVAGVDAGAKLFSVNVDTTNASPAVCTIPSPTTSSIATGMDYVMWDLILNGGSRPGLVNISINSTDFAPGGTLNSKMLTLASPYVGGYVYMGSFIAQSAGNDYINACSEVFGYSNKQPNTSDGIMVVGGIDYLGKAVAPDPNGNPGYVNEPLAGNDPGSNYGSCVEVWAPSKVILSTWGPNVGYDPSNQSTWQRNDTTYTNYVDLSGTSMAAPHVIGVAAYLAEIQNLSVPSQIEAAVRNVFFTTGQTDKKGLLLHYIQLP